MKKRIILIVLILLCTVAYLVISKLNAPEKTPPGQTPAESEGVDVSRSVKVKKDTISEYYEAVGTVRPTTESRISAQVNAQVLSVKVSPGQKVKKGDLLVVLDSRQMTTRVDQAKQGLQTAKSAERQARQGLAAAEAAFDRAKAEYDRVKAYFEGQAATQQDLEKAKSEFLQARANVNRASEAMAGAQSGIRQAQEVVREAQIGLGYTRVTAPEDAEVLQRLVEPGDLAAMGKPLIALRTTGALRLEAYVREGLIRKVAPGEPLTVELDTLGQSVTATVDEIIPYADPLSRTFLVKALLPDLEGLYPGMYGKLKIPVKQRDAILVPKPAIIKIGQLALLAVDESGVFKTRYVKTGQTFGDFVEILSGLSGDETIGIKE